MSNYNLSFYAVPAAWVLSIAPHFYAIGLSKSSRDLPEFDNCSPREFIKKVSSLEKKSPDAARYLRAEGAQQNGFENLPFFAAAVIAGNVAGLPVKTLNTFAAFYLGSRVLYNFLYITVTDEKASNLRTLSFLGGVASIFTIFVKAGNVANKAFF